MKVQELLMSIHNNDFNLEKSLEVKKYLPIELKKTIAQSIIYDCTREEDGVIKVDSVERYMSYVRHMITFHTNLEYVDSDYDVLCSTEYKYGNLLKAIMCCFEDDVEECRRILNFVMDDYMREMSMEMSIAKFLNKLSGSINDFVASIGENINNINVQEQVDMEKLNTFLNTYIQ